MAQRVVKRKKLELFFILIVILIFFTLSNKYVIKGMKDRFDVGGLVDKIISLRYDLLTDKSITCEGNKVDIFVEGGKLCRKRIASENDNRYKYLEIFDNYPKTVNGKESVYDFLDEGDIKVADNFLNNQFEIERYKSIKIDQLNWEEDPYGERYWRFIFYSLRETRHLLYAYTETGDERYRDKLVEIIEDFIDKGIDKPYAWDDYHGVAFRTMTLVNTWWKLREQNALPVDTSEKILETLKVHGNFLLEEEHYENEYNHGISQMAALLILAVNFPELDENGEWLRVATLRLNGGIDTLVDDDGILIENSPYYHFYTLEKYFLINEFLKKYNIHTGDKLEKTVQKMISYATYILQPNLKVPLLGASLQRTVGNSGVFQEIGEKNPEFLYVLTQGRRGTQPRDLNKYYSTAGQVIMRSSWDKKTKFDDNFKNQTQVIFDVGPYRTDHSDLDALSFNLYSNGKTLLTDTGLYTYEDDQLLKKYFHGTRGHNTILVDGEDQRGGSPSAGELVEKDGYTVLSAQHNLFSHINHQRAMILLGHNLVLVVDRLMAEKEHDYEQLFHLFPGAKIKKTGTTLTAVGEGEGEKLIIRQLNNEKIELASVIGDEKTGNGFCSEEYEKKIPCYMLSYKQRAQNTSYVTLLEIGNEEEYISSAVTDNEIRIETKDRSYTINLNELDVDFLKNNKLKKNVEEEYSLMLNQKSGKWRLTGKGEKSFDIKNEKGKVAIIPTENNKEVSFAESPYYELEVKDLDTYYSMKEGIFTDIPFTGSKRVFKIYEQEDFLPILGYHHVIGDKEEITYPTLQVHASDFENQIKYLTIEKGCRWFTFEDIMENYILKGEKIPKRACVLNFDDGRKNHFTNGYRIFKKYGAVATFYVVAERAAGKSASYMNFSELDELTKNGNVVGSHTVNASGLVTDELSSEEIEYQLKEAKRLLTKQGYDVTTFAYPRGEQNEEIVALTSKYYIGGRDTSKDNHWREKRPLTTSFDKNFIWHMHYHKPELESPEELWKEIGYNNWWQFEEDYQVDVDRDGDIQILSSHDPTDNSYANVSLRDPSDAISNKFIVSRDAEYTIEVYGTVNNRNIARYSFSPMMNIYVDGEKLAIEKNENEECNVYKGQYYCFYNVTVSLNEGEHFISIKSVQEDTKVDKFRMYRLGQVNDEYALNVKKIQRVFPEEYPDPLEVSISVVNRHSLIIWTYALFFGILLLLIYFRINKK